MKLLRFSFPFFFTLMSAIASAAPTAAGWWEGSALVHEQKVPVRLHVQGDGAALKAALVSGRDESVASTTTLAGDHLLLTFNYFARTLDASLTGDQLTGSFGTAAVRYPIELRRVPKPVAGAASKAGPAIKGDWEIQVKSAKGESAWQMGVRPAGTPGQIRAVIQRIDGDTGSLYGSWTGSEYRVSHFTAAGAALYSFVPRPDGTLLVSNLLAANDQKAQQQNLVARRPAAARAANLPSPTAATEQTTMKDPKAPLKFSATDLNGKVISSADPQFRGKVVIVAIGGSWCPNCHDEAPFLESLYKQFHGRGLEVVDLSFEEADQLKDPTRLRAFIKRYGLTYTVLLAGEPEQLGEKMPQAKNLNCWPTSFFVGRDGQVREIHAGFAGPANPAAHEALQHDVTSLIEHLLAEPAGVQTALRH